MKPEIEVGSTVDVVYRNPSLSFTGIVQYIPCASGDLWQIKVQYPLKQEGTIRLINSQASDFLWISRRFDNETETRYKLFAGYYVSDSYDEDRFVNEECSEKPEKAPEYFEILDNGTSLVMFSGDAFDNAKLVCDKLNLLQNINKG